MGSNEKSAKARAVTTGMRATWVAAMVLALGVAGCGGSGEPVQGCIALNLSWRLARLEQIPPDQSGLVGSVGKVGGIHQ